MQILPITTMRLWQMQPLTETEFLAFLDRHTVYCLTKKKPTKCKKFFWGYTMWYRPIFRFAFDL